MKKRTGSGLKNSSSERAVQGAPVDCSPAYRLAFADQDFLLRDELRSERLQLEFLKPELVQQQRPGHTIVLHDERPQRRVVRRGEAMAA